MPGNAPRPVNVRWTAQRLSLFYTVFVLLAAAFLVRLVNLGVVHGEHYARLSENNFLLTRPIDTPRGVIFDRYGEELAYNRSTFVVSMSPGNLTTATVETALGRLGQLLGHDLSGQYQPIVHLRPRWKSHVLRQRLTLDQATAVLEQSYNLPGVAIETRSQRYYPWGSMLCHVLGHVGKISPQMWPRCQRDGYEKDDYVGITGIEAQFERSLKGLKGLEQVWKTSRGRILSSQILQPPMPGDRLFLTIDLGLQRLAESLLLGQKGVILAADPRNGEVLAWTSSPGYDLNRPAEIANPADKPQINRAIQEYYRPGSTFKILTALAALEAGWTPDRRVTCEHRFFLPKWKRPFTCLGWHGSVDLVDGFRYSCNIYFYTRISPAWPSKSRGRRRPDSRKKREDCRRSATCERSAVRCCIWQSARGALTLPRFRSSWPMRRSPTEANCSLPAWCTSCAPTRSRSFSRPRRGSDERSP